MSLKTIGYIGGILLAFCSLPEVARTIMDGKCYIGWGMLVTWGLGELLVFIYILPKKDKPLLLNYGINLVLIGILLYYKIYGK